jgi:uncharacterized membrane protein
LMLGLSELTVPGVGPALAGGWMVTALLGAGMGASAGSLAGAHMEMGISAEIAHSPAAGLPGGRAVLSVRTDDAHTRSVLDILRPFHPTQVRVHRRPTECEHKTSSPWTVLKG